MEVTVIINTIPWDDAVEKLVAEKLNPRVGVEALKKNIESKAINLYAVVHKEKRLGILITRIDTLMDGRRELVILHAVSEYDMDVSFSSLFAPVFREIAKIMNVNAVRIHSARRGLDKLLEESGYKFFENVFVKEIEANDA
jgi:hypothetical protein